MVGQALSWVDEQLAAHCERMKASRNPVPMLAVRGGAHLVPERVPGASEVIRPRHYEVANAFGAAISEASVPMTYVPGGRRRVQVKAAGPLGG